MPGFIQLSKMSCDFSEQMAEVLCVGKAFAGAVPFPCTLTVVQELLEKSHPRVLAGGGEEMGIMCPILSGSSATTQTLLQSLPPPLFSSSAEHCRRCQISLAKLVIKHPPHTHTFTKAGIGGRVFKAGGGGWVDGTRVGALGEGKRRRTRPLPFIPDRRFV